MAKEKTPTNTSPRSKAPMPYFSLSTDDEAKAADVYIFGDIASERGGLSGLLQASSDQSSYGLANQIARIPEDYAITVHVNSNGGELKEGLGIYNVLKERNVTTVCDGFAASAGSVIFAAGKRRVMQPASLLFIHQASMEAGGNADDFQKYADDLRVITDAAVAAYKESGVKVTDEELSAMLKRETWITPEDAVRMGFATEIADVDDEERPEGAVPIIKNDAMLSIMNMVAAKQAGTAQMVVNLEAALDPAFSAIVDTLDRVAKIFDDDLIGHIKNVLVKFDEDPELMAKVKAAADTILATNPKPDPARGGNKKGFFNFRAGNGNKED